MVEDRVITEEAKYNFVALIKILGHPSIKLDKELGLDHGLYDHFLTKRSVRNRDTLCIILYMLDFGVKCNLTEAVNLQKALLEYCTRRVNWDPSFVSDDVDEMISSMEVKWTWKLVEIIHNLQKNFTDINFRLKLLLTELNKVFIQIYKSTNLQIYKSTNLQI